MIGRLTALAITQRPLVSRKAPFHTEIPHKARKWSLVGAAKDIDDLGPRGRGFITFLPRYFRVYLEYGLVGMYVRGQRRYDMRHEMLSQRAPFCIGAMAKKGTLSQHFVTHVVPPLVRGYGYSSSFKFESSLVRVRVDLRVSACAFYIFVGAGW